MKKNISFSPVTIVMLLLLVVVGVYYFTYFIPAQSELTMLRSEITLNKAETDLFEQYIADVTPLEADIAALQEEIDKLNEDGYVNDANVSLVISNAIQRYNISLTSVSLSKVTTYEEHRALPINLTMVGTLDDIIKFISHFENNTDGSYLVRASYMEINSKETTANLLIYLLTPAV